MLKAEIQSKAGKRKAVTGGSGWGVWKMRKDGRSGKHSTSNTEHPMWDWGGGWKIEDGG